jgi:RNA polymerase sigma-70 factor (ECF subfamily)
MDEITLVKASQSGDLDAFGLLTDKYYKNIYRFAYQYTRDHHEADDMCQDTFLRAFNNIAKLKKAESFKGWLYIIASNLLRRNGSNNKRRSNLFINSEQDHLADEAGPVDSMSTKERNVVIQQKVSQMPEHLRMATTLVMMEGLSQKEAARILNRSEASISRHLETARGWLREKLKKVI